MLLYIAPMRRGHPKSQAEDFEPDEASAALHLYQVLITGYQRLAGRASAAAPSTQSLESLLSGHAIAIKADIAAQEDTAADFNLLDVLRLTGNENRHSMALAWLLDRNHRQPVDQAFGKANSS